MASSVSLIFNTMFSSMFFGDLFDVVLFAVCLLRSDELWVYDRVYLCIIFESSEFFYVRLSYLCKSLRIISLVWPTRLIFLAMGEVLSFGFNLAVSFPSDSRGSKARIVLLPSRIKRWGLYHIA